MPIVNVKFSSPIPSEELCNEVAKEFTEILVKKLGKKPERTIVYFEEVDAKKFYFGGENLIQIREKETKK